MGRQAHRCGCLNEGIDLHERGVYDGGFRRVLEYQQESSMGLILLIVLIVLLMGGLPT